MSRDPSAEVVASGASVGLPGGLDVFAPENVLNLLAGEDRLSRLPDGVVEQFLGKSVALDQVDARTGEAVRVPLDEPDRVLRLAGRAGRFDLAADYGLPADTTLDRASALAVAAGLEALADAAIPLVEEAGRWRLPTGLREGTGVLFASALAGQERLVDLVRRDGNGGDGRFSPHFLEAVIPAGHAVLAAHLGAAGPAAHVSAGGASMALALSTARDWILAGRCDRVIVVGADDPTCDGLIGWVGPALMAAGAVSIDGEVARAARPFDRERGGRLPGMGAAGVVLERRALAQDRGIVPIAAFRVSWLGRVDRDAARRLGGAIAAAWAGCGQDADPAELLYMTDHGGEPGTPVELAGLRQALGDDARKVVVTNTKGLTGDAFGAGVEDVAVLKALQYGRVPPVAHLSAPDEGFEDLSFSEGGLAPVRFGLRVALGQRGEAAVLAWERLAGGDERQVDAAAYDAWLRAVAGPDAVQLDRTTRVLRAVPPEPQPAPPEAPPAEPEAEPPLDDPQLSVEAAEWAALALELSSLDPVEPPSPVADEVPEDVTDPPSPLATLPLVELPESPAEPWTADEPIEDGADPVQVVGRSAEETPPPHPGPEAELPPSFRVRRPTLVPVPPPEPGNLEGRVVQVVGTGPLSDALRRAVMVRGAAPGGRPDAVVDASDEVHESFEVARALDAARPRTWMAVTRLGADSLWMDRSRAMADGARAGLAKALGREWPGCKAQVVDVDPALDAGTTVAMICDELAADHDLVEVYRCGEQRRYLDLRVEPFPATDGRLEGNPLILLTGGTRGVTARIGIELARRGKCRLVLMARTSPGTEPFDEVAARAAVRAGLAAAGQEATLHLVEQRLEVLRAAEEARINIAAMKSLGAEVHFQRVEMADPAAVQAGLAEVVERYGAVAGVVHGAGVVERQPLRELDDGAFERVFVSKAVGGRALLDALEPGTWFVSLGSVAGRFGAAEQAAYAAANDALARICQARSRALHVVWPEWEGGRGTGGLAEQGVEPLPAGPGAALLVDMIASGYSGEVVVAGRMGRLARTPPHPLLDAVEVDGERVVATRRLSLESDPWLQHYAPGGVPALPASLDIELLAAVAAQARPGRLVTGARDVQLRAPVRLHGNAPVTVTLRAEPAGSDEVRCTLTSERVGPGGQPVRALHAEAVVLLGDTEPINAIASLVIPEHALDRGEVYQRLSRGPAFQVLDRAGAIAEQALMAEARVDHLVLGPGMLTRPLATEAAVQAVLLHQLALEGVFARPVSIGRLQIEGVVEGGEPLSLLARREGQVYDVDVDGPDGAVLRVRSLWAGDGQPAAPDERLDAPEGGWPQATVLRPPQDGPVR